MSITVSMRSARSQDMAVCAGIFNDWIDQTEWMPRVHPHDDVVKHYEEDEKMKRNTIVAVDGARVRGFMTISRDGFLTALYVEEASRNQGIGGLLLARAKRELSPEVNLYTFQANEKAQAFYTRHGFVEVNRTTGDNEENLPDILMEWRE
jgi:ribosomal protein S18 acetylase RimI-like enzyme